MYTLFTLHVSVKQIYLHGFIQPCKTMYKYVTSICKEGEGIPKVL
jgi:hypothetical protein